MDSIILRLDMSRLFISTFTTAWNQMDKLQDTGRGEQLSTLQC
jgi:hypothetical protein